MVININYKFNISLFNFSDVFRYVKIFIIVTTNLYCPEKNVKFYIITMPS